MEYVSHTVNDTCSSTINRTTIHIRTVVSSIQANGRQHIRCFIPQAVSYSLMLLKMGITIAKKCRANFGILIICLLLHLVDYFLYYMWLSCYSTAIKRPYEKLITDFSKIPNFLHHTNKVAFSKTQPLYYTRYQTLAETLMRMSVLWDMTPC